MVQPPSSRLEPPILFQSRMHWQERTNPTPIIKDNITYKTARVPTETTCARYEALPCSWEGRTTGSAKSILGLVDRPFCSERNVLWKDTQDCFGSTYYLLLSINNAQ